MTRIAVMGGGVAGLATALLLARGAHEVVLFEEDATDPGTDLDTAFFRQSRPRVPQAVQPHALSIAADVRDRIEKWLKRQPEVAQSSAGPSRDIWETVAAGGAVVLER
jgi:2-polyprenyl-6-methoxyphenol hydroxylase-like FAD-dependent oxidoreductase